MGLMTDEQKKLAEENHNLIYSFLREHKLSIEEYYGLASIGLCRACMDYDSSKSKFSTYAYSCMYTQVMHQIRSESAVKRGRGNQTVSYQETFKHDGRGDDVEMLEVIPSRDNTENEAVARIVIGNAVSSLSERDRKVIGLISAGYGQTETGSMVGLSQASVSKIVKEFREQVV